MCFFSGANLAGFGGYVYWSPSHPLVALRIPAEQTIIANKRSPFCIGNIFKTIDVQGLFGVFLWSLFIGICSFNTVSKTKSPGGFCVFESIVANLPFPFPQKNVTKNTQKHSTWRKDSRRVFSARAGGGWLRQHLVGRHGVSYVFDVFYEPQRSGRRFLGSSRIRVFGKNTVIEAFGMDPSSKWAQQKEGCEELKLIGQQWFP